MEKEKKQTNTEQQTEAGKQPEAKKKVSAGKILIEIILLIALAALMAGIYHFAGPKTMKGSKEYTLEVVDDKGEVTKYEGRTDEEYLRGALEELEEAKDFSMDGEEGEYGLFVTEVNGLTAEFEKDNAYWSIYVNDEYGMLSLEQQPVTDGDEYRIVYESVDDF